MKLLDTTPLQETQKEQMLVGLNKRVKEQAKAMGWKKGDLIAIYRHGAGFFISKAGNAEAEELKAGQPASDKGEG